MMIQPVDSALVPGFALPGGVSIPCIGLGTFGSDGHAPGQVAAAAADAIRCGYRLLDCASVYGNEAQIGDALSAVFAEGVVRREELFIASKVWNDMHGKGDVLLSLARTLRDLKLNALDCYFVHWPFANFHAPGCGVDSRDPHSRPFAVDRFMDTWRQMERAQAMGLTRFIGMSNMTIPKLKAVLPLCAVQPTLIEMELHPAFQQPELFAYCLERGIQPVGYCPLGSPGRPARDRTPEDTVDTELPEVLAAARAHNIPPALVCLKWAAQRGQIPIPFSVDAGHIAANLRCVTEDPLTDAEMEALKGADRDCRLIKGQVFLWQGASDWEDLWDLSGTITR
jgi:alcohol dehydrogenase (NADP+)